jgi:hypothetical protein
MTEYCFRLRFRIVDRLDVSDQPRGLDAPPLITAAQIFSSQPRVPGVDQWIAIKSCGYASRPAAEAAALRLKDTVLVAGATGFGADFGINKVRNSLSDKARCHGQARHSH